jgi:hypothetical protein
MHPRQASVLDHATEIAARIAATVKKPLSGQPILWKYTDEEARVFYLEEKKLTGVRSPYNGKVISGKPERFTPAQVGKEMKEEAKAAKADKTAFWKA